MSTRSDSFAFPPILTHPIARMLMAAMLIAVVLVLVDGRRVWLHLKTFDASVGVAMLAVNGLLIALFAARWRTVAASLGIDAPYARFLCGTWLAAFASQLGPSLVLNEVTRFRLLLPFAGTWPLAASQFLDRVSGQIVLAGVILLLMPYYFGLFGTDVSYRILLTIVVVVLCAGSFLILAQSFRSVRLQTARVRGILNPLTSPAHYAYSIAIQLLLMTNLWLAAHALGAEETHASVYLVAPLVLGSLTLLPISIGDWGSREAAALLFFSAAGLTAEKIVAISVIYGIANLASALPAALLLLVWRARTPTDAAPAPAATEPAAQR